MKFDFCIGNPPYQEETESDSTRTPPVYNLFMDAAYSISDAVELITPARFLFNTGFTPKDWNNKMLSDPHFKILDYEINSSNVFPSMDITGGVAISYRDNGKEFGPIEIFVKFDELRSALNKVRDVSITSLETIMHSPLNYQFSQLGEQEIKKLYPGEYDDERPLLRTSSFTKFEKMFEREKPDSPDYISIIGILKNKRTFRYIQKDYIRDGSGLLDTFNVILPNSNGSGAIGEVESTQLIGEPLIGRPGLAYMQSFISIGSFSNETEALNAMKYIKSKFARAMLGILKSTQHNPPARWKYVPLQDFTEASDIDWLKSIPVIDQQLYAKYGLSDEEIEFIESHVKAMS